MPRLDLPNLRELVAVLREPPRRFDQVLEFQVRRVRQLAEHAHGRVPYYRRLFDQSGFRPDSIRTMDDIRRLPITAKSDLQGLPPEEIVAQGTNPASLRQGTTSGSTGQPLTVRWTLAERRLQAASLWKAYRRMGNRLTDRRASILLGRGRAARRNPWYGRLGLFPMERIDMMQPSEEILRRLREVQPEILISEAGAASWLAGELGEEDRLRIRPRIIVTWGETLTPAMRQQVEEGFAAPVVDHYVSIELLGLAFQCRTTGLYHVFDRMNFVEVLIGDRPAEAGEQGELVGTALQSFAMPFLRYRLGDLVTMGPTPCPCGMVCRTIANISGRVMDRIPLRDGSFLHPFAIIRPFAGDFRWVRRFQFRQVAEGAMVLQVVAGRPPVPEEVEAVRRAIEEKLGHSYLVDVQIVERITPSPTGKHYPYVSQERLEAWGQGRDAE